MSIDEIRHPILRETLKRRWRGSPLEIASVADVPSGTGMGSSEAFTVTLLKALVHARRTSIARGPLRLRARSRSTSCTSRAARQDTTSPLTGAFVHTRSIRTGRSTSIRSSSPPRRCGISWCSSTPVRPATRQPSCPIRTGAPRPVTTKCSRTCTGPGVTTPTPPRPAMPRFGRAKRLDDGAAAPCVHPGGWPGHPPGSTVRDTPEPLLEGPTNRS
jgi:hypothetical protein